MRSTSAKVLVVHAIGSFCFHRMKKSLFVLAALLCNTVLAQDEPVPAQTVTDTPGSRTMESNWEHVEAPPPPTPQTEEVFNSAVVEVKPEFPGGQDAMYRFIAQNMIYPPDMVEAGVQGKAYIEFVVRRDGSITDVVVKRGVAPSGDAEAVRVLKAMPKWTPATLNGKSVTCTMVMPLQFTLK